ncbi:MAG: hypothetical protein ACNA8P_12645, partial [Phycisphaerales bacterium]
NISIANPNNGDWRIYSNNPLVDRLGTISFTGSTSGRTYRVIIGRPGIEFNPFQSAGVGAVLDWTGGLSAPGANVSIQASVHRYARNISANWVARLEVDNTGSVGGAITGNIHSSGSSAVVLISAPEVQSSSGTSTISSSGPIRNINIQGNCVGNLSANPIEILNVDGDYRGSISSNGTTNRFTVLGDLGTNLNSSVSISNYDGESSLPFTVGGDLRADLSFGPSASSPVFIEIDGDVLGSKIVHQGVMGLPLNRVIVAGEIRESDLDSTRKPEIYGLEGINRIEAAGMRNFAPGAGASLGVGVRSPFVAEVICDGDFISSVSLEASQIRQMNILGDFDADLEIVGSLPAVVFGIGGFDAQGQIRIDGSLKAGAAISYPSLDLMGEVIVNHAAAGGLWLGDVVVGSTTLGPNYPTAASALGGGSVGVVPFAAHRVDSVPELNEVLPFIAGTLPDEFFIRHYGPVQIDQSTVGTGDPIRLFRRAQCTTDADWLEVTDEWAFTPSVEANRTVIKLAFTKSGTGPYRNGFEYRFAAQNDIDAAGSLRCDLGAPGIDVAEPGVADYPNDAWFSVGNGCPVDVDGSGTIDLPDLNAVLA